MTSRQHLSSSLSKRVLPITIAKQKSLMIVSCPLVEGYLSRLLPSIVHRKKQERLQRFNVTSTTRRAPSTTPSLSKQAAMIAAALIAGTEVQYACIHHF